MANQLKMADVQALMALHERGWSKRRIARELGIDRETVGRYVRLAEAVTASPASAPRLGGGCRGRSGLKTSQRRPPALWTLPRGWRIQNPPARPPGRRR